MPKQEPVLDDVFQALADPTRRAVLQRLSKGPASVKDPAEPFSMALPSFLQHLLVLEQGGSIRSKKIGRVRTCEMGLEAIGRAESWITKQRLVWETRLHQLDAYLSELQTEEQSSGKKRI